MVYNIHMSKRIDELLTDGLLAGYASKNEPATIEKVGFVGKSNDYTNSNTAHYHDEWFGSENGGGQELVDSQDGKGTRLYAGGVISLPELEALGITKADVTARLITSIRTLKDKTRLRSTCFLSLGEGWEYKYDILKTSEEVPLRIGYESISYKEREVFAHGFLISPVK